MFRPLALALVAGLVFATGCGEKKGENNKIYKKIPTAAPKVAKSAGAVLEHLQYAVVRKDPKHLEQFYPKDDHNKAIGAATTFHYYAGGMGSRLTAEEIDTIGVRDLVEKGYLSEDWTSLEFNTVLKELDAGKRDKTEPGMEKVNQMRLDMPLGSTSSDPKIIEKMKNDLLEAVEANPKAIYVAGLYRLLKVLPNEGWAAVRAVIAPDPRGDVQVNVLRIMADDELIMNITVGHNGDETMYVWGIEPKQSARTIAKMFPPAEEKK